MAYLLIGQLLNYKIVKYACLEPTMSNKIGIMYECMLLCGDRIDMAVSKNIDLPEFELMSKTFYKAMSKYFHKID